MKAMCMVCGKGYLVRAGDFLHDEWICSECKDYVAQRQYDAIRDEVIRTKEIKRATLTLIVGGK